jgi:phosphoribosylformylglycinamidine cyclo-ligase
MEIYVNERYAQEIIEISKAFDVDAKVIGNVRSSDKNRLTIKSHHGEFEY